MTTRITACWSSKGDAMITMMILGLLVIREAFLIMEEMY